MPKSTTKEFNMSINMKKGESVNLTKESKGTLNQVMIGTGWDALTEGKTMDADLSVFALNADGKCRSPKDFIFFNNLGLPGDAIHHSGDNLTGEGDGDDEQINVDLTRLDAEITTIDIILNIYDAKSKGQDFKDLKNAFVRMVNKESDEEIAMFDVHDGMKGDTLHFGRLTRTSDGWVFLADGQTSEKGLTGLKTEFGL